MLLEKGKGGHFLGKSLNEIQLDNNIYYSSESENEEARVSNVAQKGINELSIPSTSETNNRDLQVMDAEFEGIYY
ncbi:hypothetical protein NQ314_015416 [Rhamnusium bicolor]|uniref:Uncharacterized protein n=1 Tax=Rhamnusium bicolor TaxID=1586634 RepID=A0AAV8WZH4_9CUCU|nr:hypothetical protein NQ314_015416 [Rhamnusium bicolor]